MAALILSPANCEIRAVIRFPHSQKESPAEIHQQLCHVYGPDIMSERMVRRRCGQFNEGRSNVHDEYRRGRPSLVTPELMENVRQIVFQNRCFTISELSGQFSPDVSLTAALRMNLAVCGRQYQCSHFLLVRCINYCQHKTETALHFPHILPLYCYACAFASH